MLIKTRMERMMSTTPPIRLAAVYPLSSVFRGAPRIRNRKGGRA
jgi:hypothetical protein